VTAAIVRAEARDAGWIADLIGGEFQHLGPALWLVPDPTARARILPRNFRIYVEHALAHGEVQVTADRSAAAVWVPRGLRDLPPPENYDQRLKDACEDCIDRFLLLDELFDKHHPEAPHEYLALLAVRSDVQRQGIGSRMLATRHAELDRDGVAAFLEASSPGSRDLYARHGYVLNREPYGVPSGALFWPMWREAREPVS
jgi:GNAT superfamily N-acetyltransferase